MELKIGRIVATHPEKHMVDAVFPSDGRHIKNIRVMSNSASSHSGSMNLPSPVIGKGSMDVGGRPLGSREMTGIFGSINDSFVCLGFVFPHKSQVMPTAPNTSIDRHVSGVYTMTDANGNFEFVHPSGTYIRVGDSPDHASMQGGGANGNWDIKKKSPGFITINQGKASLTIDPSGNISIRSSGNMDIKVDGTFDCESGGNMSFKAPRIDLNK